jgi:hypothetical protein
MQEGPNRPQYISAQISEKITGYENNYSTIGAKKDGLQNKKKSQPITTDSQLVMMFRLEFPSEGGCTKDGCI